MASLLTMVLLTTLNLLINFSACQQTATLSPIKWNVSADTIQRSAIDLFTTKSNTIIRTKESRDLGARYLNESDQLTQEECNNWCWNYTPAESSSPCNVAVYEQKDRHSCYLFDCGTPQQFKCKFTEHDSYSSSIFNGTRQTYELDQWRQQSKHESDLKNLLHVNPFNNFEKSIINGVLTATPAINSRNNVPRTSEKRVCQHFQFPCKNGTECIAIYNVCDGITQCPDGSDESEDLRCPQVIANYNPKTEQAYKSVAGVPRKGPTDDLLANPRMFQESLEYPKLEATELDLNRDKAYNNKFSYNGLNGGFRFNSMQPQTESLNPTGAYLFPDPDYPRDLTPLFWPSVPRRPPPPPTNELRESVLRPTKINLEPLSQPLLGLSQLPSDGGHKDWFSSPRDPSFSPQQLDLQLSGEKHPASARVPALYSDPRSQTIGHISKPIPLPDHQTSSTPTSQFQSSRLVSSPETVAVTHLKDSGMSGRDTNSAVIALTLGICITVLLVVLVGCRMKSMHKKIARRGGRSLAHDADYLVNGMYL